MFTLRVTDEQIKAWQARGNMDRLCPLSAAALQELTAMGTPVTYMHLAQPSGNIRYRVGFHVYKLVVRSSEQQAMAKFIYAVDHSLIPARRVFHFYAEQSY